jgi:hypothetical protein
MEKIVLCLLPDYVLNSPIFKTWECYLRNKNIEIKKVSVTGGCKDYLKLFQDHKNIITWNCRTKHDWIKNQNKNVLFIDNSFFIQASGIFLDSEGFFSDSNLKKRCLDIENITEEEKNKIKNIVYNKFKYDFFSHNCKNKKILVALQHHLDSNINFQFPFGEKFTDKVEATLCFVKTFLNQDLDITIRPHPRFLKHWEENLNNYKKSFWNDRWVIDYDKSPYLKLSEYNALISVNSTLVNEAICLGIPIATLGVGAFSEHGVTLECSHDFQKLKNILDFEPSEDKTYQYIYKALRYNTLHHTDSELQIITNAEWQNFFKKIV